VAAEQLQVLALAHAGGGVLGAQVAQQPVGHAHVPLDDAEDGRARRARYVAARGILLRLDVLEAKESIELEKSGTEDEGSPVGSVQGSGNLPVKKTRPRLGSPSHLERL
jgi:hypothetical protein